MKIPGKCKLVKGIRLRTALNNREAKDLLDVTIHWGTKR